MKSHKITMKSYKITMKSKKITCKCGKNEGKQNYRTEVEEYEGTVIYRTLLFYNSVFLGRYEKNVSEFTPNLFRRSILIKSSLNLHFILISASNPH